LLFNLPTWQPAGYAARAVRSLGSACDAPITENVNSIDYLDTFPTDMDKYIQGALEAHIITTNGVRNSNRGDGDIISILIRRGREMGVPSFTDLREQVALKASGCAWDSWDVVGGPCDPTNVFPVDKIDALKSLYHTPSDVELIVGASLAGDRVPTSFSEDLHATPIDATQAYLLIGEILRIINLDAYSAQKALSPASDSFYARFRNDDPGFQCEKTTGTLSACYPVNGLSFSEGLIAFSAQGQAQLLIQFNSDVKCLQKLVFIQGGFSTFFNNPQNIMTLPFPNGPTQDVPVGNEAKYYNCDLSGTAFDTFSDGDGFTYGDYYCGGNYGCWQPELPICV